MKHTERAACFAHDDCRETVASVSMAARLRCGIARAGMFTAGLALASALPATPVQAQAGAQVSPPPRSQLAPPELERRDDRAVTLTIDGDMERTACVLDRAEYADITLTLDGVRFAGLERVPGLSLAAAHDGYLGREVPLSVMCDIRARANALLRSQGYLATVEIPEQNLSDGVADFGVVFGRLTGLRVRGDAGPSEGVVAAYLEKLTEMDVFNIHDAERSLLIADDLPGIDVRLSLRPAAGGAPGDLVGEIAVVRRRGLLDLNVQNYGSKALGRFGGLLRGELYDLTGLGDRTTIALFSTLEFGEQHTLQLGHDFAVGDDGLRLGGMLTYSETEPDLNLPGFDLESETIVGSLYASYPLQRMRHSSQYLSTGFDIVDQDVEVNGAPISRDRVRTAFVRYSGEIADRASIQRVGGYTPFEPSLRARYALELRQGFDVLSASPDCRGNTLACVLGTTPPSRIEADPTPLLLRYDAGFEYRPVPQFTFALTASGQVTGDGLPAYEEFSAGSFSIGRGYDPGAVLGDSGVSVAAELRYGSIVPDGTDALALQPFVFTDMAWAWNEDPSRRPLNPDRLWSAGGGLRAVWGSRIQAETFLAVPIKRPDLAATRGDVRFMVSVTARILPWR
ncbi:ShlB/FhaC/HecB family hemolysin secretion/activation protein [Qipengyuania nanhaisediminis]|uniref:ShlB/FhaC/HecB family hemolysin secretion/activation protein n=1 Tax=Qipengyuania nanhaisediminis TaxID=604088 RepID=UPI0038B3A007